MNNFLVLKSNLKKNAIAEISGSKSIANRALIISAISKGETVLSNLPKSDDVSLLMKILDDLGVFIEQIDEKSVKILGNNGKFSKIKNANLFCKIAGTTSRFASSLSLLCNEKIVITGDGRLLERPIGGLCDGLFNLGADIKFLGNKNCVPFEIKKERKTPDSIILDASLSSQFLSSILMISPRLENGLTVFIKTSLASKSYVDLTIDLMKNFGVCVDFNEENNSYSVKNSEYIAKKYSISGDYSSASYFFALPLILSGEISLLGLDLLSKQGDRGVLEIIEKIGGKVDKRNDKISIFSDGTIKPINVNMQDMPDSSMTIASILIFAEGVSKISGLSTLKNKETDRLFALKTEFEKIGIKSNIDNDSITIFGNPYLKNEKKISINTYHDHRMAMCFAIIGARIGGLEIENPDVVSKSMPEFWNVFKSVGCDFLNA